MKSNKQVISSKKLNHHDSVLYKESIEGLNIKPDGIYIDATLGRGGHTQGILDKLGKSGKVIAFDQDIDAIKYVKLNLTDSRLSLIHSNFSMLESELIKLNLYGRIDGILMDLGISSPQIDNPERGFSFNKDGALDMRMDQTQSLTAARWLKNSTETEIANALYQYGEEKKSRLIASNIKKYQQNNDINTTLELANLISKIIKPGKKKHPATRSFLAIRIVINDELKKLSHALEQTIGALSSNGRLAVITFHSLEDRIVKQFVHKYSRHKAIPKGLPIPNNQGEKLILKDLFKIKPSSEELLKNRRSRSAILRLVEKC